MPVPRFPPFPLISRLVCINTREVVAAMARFLHSDFFDPRRKFAPLLLACAWTFGLLAGAVLFYTAGPLPLSTTPSPPFGQVSVIGLLCVTWLPFLFSAFAVYLSHPGWILSIAFLKGASFSFVSARLLAQFGSAGWLFRMLLMFSDLAMLPLLFIFWLRYLPGDRKIRLSTIAVFLLWSTLIGSLDYCLISPFLASL